MSSRRSHSLIYRFPLASSAVDGALHSVMAEHKPEDFIELDVDVFDLEELLNYEPPPLQVQPVRNTPWINNNNNNQEDVIGDTIDPMEDPFIQGLFVDAGHPSCKHRNFCQNESFPISEEGGELGFRSVPSAPISCSFCLVLREIVHTNGNSSLFLMSMQSNFD